MSIPDGRVFLRAASATAREFFIPALALFLVIMIVLSIFAY
jgi:hypothetical protein